MSTNFICHACSDLDRALEGSTLVTTSEMYQENQVSTAESNHVGCNYDTETHEDKQSHDGDKICDGEGSVFVNLTTQRQRSGIPL